MAESPNSLSFIQPQQMTNTFTGTEEVCGEILNPDREKTIT
jgi:hypothetical protein